MRGKINATYADSLIVELMTLDGTVKNSSSHWIELKPSESKRITDLSYEFYEIVKRKEFLVARADIKLDQIIP